MAEIIDPAAVFETTKEQEQALCGAVMRDGTVFEKVNEIVRHEDFRTETLRWLWQAFERLHEAGLKIDTFSAGDELERMGKMQEFTSGQWHGRVYLANIRTNGNPKNAVTYATTVKDYSNKRRLLQQFNEGAGWAMNGRRAKDIVSDMMNGFSKMDFAGVEDEYTVPISTALSEALDWTQRASDGKIPGVKTGFKDLDNLLGSLFADNVYIVAGRPGRGKTGFLLSVAKHAAEEGKKIAIFSLEMSRVQVAQRLISQMSEIDLSVIINGKYEDGKELQPSTWSGLYSATEKLERLGISINDLSSIAINQVTQTARRLQAQGGLDLVILDYIQLATASGADMKKNGNREQEVSAISRGLKYLARELHVPVLAAAQLSRAVEQRANGRPQLSDLRESGTLEQDAYGVMFIHRPDMNGEEGAQPGVAEIILEKHRNGKTGSAELQFDAPRARFRNLAQKVYGS